MKMVESSSVKQRFPSVTTRTSGPLDYSFDAPHKPLGNDSKIRQRTAWAMLGLLVVLWTLILASLISY
jgi:hypothetical protein